MPELHFGTDVLVPALAGWRRIHDDARTLQAFTLTDGQWLRIAALKDDDAVSVTPFDAISFSLAALWA